MPNFGKLAKGALSAVKSAEDAAAAARAAEVKASIVPQHKPAAPLSGQSIDLSRIKEGGLEIPASGFSKEDKAKLRPLYNQGLIRVEEKDGKKMIVPGRGAWYEFATPEQQTALDSFQKSNGVRDLSLMSPTESILNSAQASFYDFEIVPGVRNVPIKNLEPFLPGYESPQEMKRIQDLANQIKESKQIEPLFIGVDPNGSQYIMEGQHRIRALKSLGYDEIPAKLVIDMDDVTKAAGGEVKMAEGGAAFGVFPQMKPRRSKQDREAAKNVPVDLARGFVAGALGMPGDIESLARLLMNLQGPDKFVMPQSKDEALAMLGQIFAADRVGLDTKLPTSEDIEKRLPFKSDSPVSQAATGLGQIGGGFYTGPLSGARAVTAVPGALMRAGKDFVQAAGQPAVNVIKPKGGNFLTGSVEKAVSSLKPRGPTHRDEALILGGHWPDYAETPQGQKMMSENSAINNWIDRNLTNYIKKEMATPEDPVRKLAEQGIVHKQFHEIADPNSVLMQKRMGAGMPAKPMAQTEAGQFWENLADRAIDAYPAGSYKHGALDETLLERNPWLAKTPDETMIYSGKGLSRDLGFDHIVDVLRQDLASGRIRPEQLNKVSMEQAVRRTYEFDQEMAKKMREAQIKATEGMPVHKEYPEGYKWIELTAPELKELPEGYQVKRTSQNLPYLVNPEGVNVGYFEEGAGQAGALRRVSEDRLKDALKYEGETMGHCVGGYCPDVLEGRSRIYSLRDAKGEPHVTVEVNPSSQRVAPRHEEVLAEMKASGLNTNHLDDLAYDIEYEQALQRVKQNRPPAIVQIKGKQNRAPKEEYLPYVQDFVRGGKWSQVGDFQNTGLYRKSDFIDEFKPEQLDAIGQGEYLTMDEIKKLREGKPWKPIDTRPELDINIDDLGMKRGGSVSISDNADAQMMDVLDKKMAGGGLAKLARAAAKSKQEIEAIAERMAPQVTGEFVRGPQGTQSVAGKTQKQFAREKDLPVKFTDVKPVPKVEVLEPEKLKGMVVTGIPGDPTITGKSLVSVGDIKLDSPSPQHGGPLYGLGKDDVFWASGIGPAGNVQRVAKEAMQAYDAPVAGQYIMMGPDSINYAQHFADANLSAIDLSKMNKKQIEQFNKLIRFGDEKSGPRPGFPGIENKEEAYLHLAFDPHLRRHFNKLMQMPTVTERLNLPSGQDIRFAVTEAPLRDLETGVTGYSMGRLSPEVPKSALPLSEHPTYSHDIPGQFMGGLKYPTPYELTFPDTLKSVRENPKQAGQEFGSLKMVGPRQIYDQQMIDELNMYQEAMKRLTGKKKGGAVKMAEGGAAYNTVADMSDGGQIIPGPPFADGGLIKVTKKRKAKA